MGHESALEQQVEGVQRVRLVGVVHQGDDRVPARRDEGPARAAPPAVEQAVLAHPLQGAAYGDLTDPHLLGEDAGIRKPVSGRDGLQAHPQGDP